ncbi:MAG: hypothetical protein MJY54_01595 [archaeon]|nr:hypothetical protein [archaeon]
MFIRRFKTNLSKRRMGDASIAVSGEVFAVRMVSAKVECFEGLCVEVD